MEELKPLTMSRSIAEAPSVLLTQSKDTYLLYAPINEHLIIQQSLLKIICEHFKIDALRVGSFTFKSKKYFCVEELSGVLYFSPNQEHLWFNKRAFNCFLNPSDFFKMFLVELFFPYFKSLDKVIVTSLKNQAVVYPVTKSMFSEIAFEEAKTTVSQLNHPAIKRFFSYCKEEVYQAIISFNLLNNDKLMMDLKYQLSLYPDQRNAYWNELKKCTSKEFMTYTANLVWDYFHRLGTK